MNIKNLCMAIILALVVVGCRQEDDITSLKKTKNIVSNDSLSRSRPRWRTQTWNHTFGGSSLRYKTFYVARTPKTLLTVFNYGPCPIHIRSLNDDFDDFTVNANQAENVYMPNGLNSIPFRIAAKAGCMQNTTLNVIVSQRY